MKKPEKQQPKQHELKLPEESKVRPISAEKSEKKVIDPLMYTMVSGSR